MADNVIFNEAEHSYKNRQGKRYTSSTTLVSKFKQPFDKVAVSKAYAKKNGGTAEQWQKKWSEISEVACAKGTAFHKKKEESILANAAIIKPDSKVAVVHHSNDLKKLPQFDYKNIPNGIQTELLVWNHDLEIAGQVDFVDFEGKWFDIDDHKTNKKIDMWSFRHPKTGYKMMQFPLQHLMDTNYNHYALQLSIYAFMIEHMTGKQLRDMCFHHYPPDILEDDGVSKEGIRYTVPYLKKEVLDMLAVYTKKDVDKYR